MRLCFFSAFVIVTLAVMAVGLLRTKPVADRQPSVVAPVYVVEMRDNYFDPPGLLVQLNESVTWVLSEVGGSSGHSATAYHPSQDKELRIPEQAQPFNSNVFKRLNNRYTFKFPMIGVYDYFCIPHEDVGMVGRVIVQEAIGPGTQPLDKGISPAGQSMMPTIEEILGLNGKIFNFLAGLNSIPFLAQQGRRDQATAQLKLLQQEWLSGTNKSGSLYESVKTVELSEDFSKQLLVTEEALAKNSALAVLQELIQKAKEILNKAMSKLNQKEL